MKGTVLQRLFDSRDERRLVPLIAQLFLHENPTQTMSENALIQRIQKDLRAIREGRRRRLQNLPGEQQTDFEDELSQSLFEVFLHLLATPAYTHISYLH